MTRPEIEVRLDLLVGRKKNTTRYVSKRKGKRK
jgi:hypothetical protein